MPLDLAHDARGRVGREIDAADFQPPRLLGIVSHQDREHSPVMSAFINLAEKVFKTIGQPEVANAPHVAATTTRTTSTSPASYG